MRIVHTVEFYQPSVGGMQEVVRQLSERLAAMGHHITVATTRLRDRKETCIKGVEIMEFDISGNTVRGMTGDIEKYQHFLTEGNYDVMVNFAAQQWATDAALPVLGRIEKKKVFVPTGFSALYAPEYREYFEKMAGWMNCYDMNVFLSDDYRDVNFAREKGIEKRMLIPNGAGEDEFLCSDDIDVRKKLGIPGHAFLVLHVGTHTGVKGHREAMEIFSKAAIPHAVLLIVGNRPDSGGCHELCRREAGKFNRSPFRLFDKKKIIIADISREETVAAYKAADLFLFPSNIECSPIVLFECMASRTPFLTADVGNSKEIAAWSGSGVVMPTKKDSTGYGMSYVDVRASAQILKSLAGNSEKRREMQEKGFEIWQEKYSWEKISLQYEELYKNLLSEQQRQG